MKQVDLPLDLEMRIKESDIAYFVNHMVEQTPAHAFSSFVRLTGCPPYHQRMMWLSQGYALYT